MKAQTALTPYRSCVPRIPCIATFKMDARRMPCTFQQPLILVALATLLITVPGHGQKAPRASVAPTGNLQGKVVDARGAPLAQSTILDPSGHVLATTGVDGASQIPQGIPEVQVSNPHYVTVTVLISDTAPLTVGLERPLETV